ncbi:MAG: hypothetical protein KIT10_06705 [Flavobacteriales bacterium]|nr:hypothetical protein [Flavobacteriales bacterium]
MSGSKVLPIVILTAVVLVMCRTTTNTTTTINQVTTFQSMTVEQKIEVINNINNYRFHMTSMHLQDTIAFLRGVMERAAADVKRAGVAPARETAGQSYARDARHRDAQKLEGTSKNVLANCESEAAQRKILMEQNGGVALISKTKVLDFNTFLGLKCGVTIDAAVAKFGDVPSVSKAANMTVKTKKWYKDVTKGGHVPPALEIDYLDEEVSNRRIVRIAVYGTAGKNFVESKIKDDKLGFLGMRFHLLNKYWGKAEGDDRINEVATYNRSGYRLYKLDEYDNELAVSFRSREKDEYVISMIAVYWGKSRCVN